MLFGRDSTFVFVHCLLEAGFGATFNVVAVASRLVWLHDTLFSNKLCLFILTSKRWFNTGQVNILMAAFPNISDNEMNYFQFKARQLLLLKKENLEWKEYCKQVAPECAECSAEKANSESSKSIGIQVVPQKPTVGIAKQHYLPAKKQNSDLPEALNHIKVKLENIDLALSKMYDSSSEKKEDNELKRVSEKKFAAIPVSANINLSAHASKSFEERRKLLIQNSLKASIEKMHSLSPKKPMKPVTAIKKKESGFFLPHDLQVKRVAARKAYLASLKTSHSKPKAAASKDQEVLNKQSSLSKKVVHKPVSKPKKKVAIKPQKPIVAEVETLVKNVETDEYKDENVENVVDGILEDLLLETVLDLGRIRHLRAQRQVYSFDPNQTMRDRKNLADNNLSNKNIAENTIPKTLAMDDSPHLMKLMSFLESSAYSEKRHKDIRKGSIDNCENPLPSEIPEQKIEEIEKNPEKIASFHKPYDVNIGPKFVCGASHIVSIDPIKVNEISLHRERFWKYLRDISRTIKGSFNPWTFCNVIAESILDDCIQDIAEELSDVPSTIIKDLYNQEFIKQVEC